MKYPSLGLRVATEHRETVRRVVDTLRRFPGALAQFEMTIDRIEREAAERRLAAAPAAAAPPPAPPAPPKPAAAPLLRLETVPPAPDHVEEAVRAWNETAARIGRPQVVKVEGARLIALKARLRDGGIAGWREMLRRVERSALMRGEVPGNWPGATFDWVCKAANYTKLMEGNYDDDARRGGSASGGFADILEGVAAGLARDVGARR